MDLQFNHTLLLLKSTSDLNKRLKELRSLLSTLQQETVNKASLQAVRTELISQKLLGHKDKSIRILVACCCSDLLRLYAPEPPFDPAQLKQLFALFFKQLHGIGDPHGPYFSDYYYLLDSMCTVRSVTLVSDLHADNLITELITDFFDMISAETSPSVGICMLEMMQQLIEECLYLPMPVVEILLVQFERKTQISRPAAFKLACELGVSTADKLQRYVCQYFSDVIIASSRDNDDEDLDDFKNAHKLVLELNKHAPSLLLNVISQIEEELKVETLTIRQFATATLGEMFTESGPLLISQYPQVWQSWIDRRNDKQVAIRVTWVEYCVLIVQRHPEMLKHLEASIAQKIMDPDEKVRLATIKAIDNLTDGFHIVSQATLKELAGRCRDKKQTVRAEAIRTLGQLFFKIYAKFLSLSDKDVQLDLEPYLWIPGTIIELLYLTEPEVM